MKIDDEETIQDAKDRGLPVANPEVVHEIFEALRTAVDGILSAKREKPIEFVDMFMATVNFVRLIVEDIEERGGFVKIEAKREFRSAMINTITRSLLRRLSH